MSLSQSKGGILSQALHGVGAWLRRHVSKTEETRISFAFASVPCTFPCPAPLTSSFISLHSTLTFSPISSIHLPYPLPFLCPPLPLFAALEGLGIAYAATASIRPPNAFLCIWDERNAFLWFLPLTCRVAPLWGQVVCPFHMGAVPPYFWMDQTAATATIILQIILISMCNPNFFLQTIFHSTKCCFSICCRGANVFSGET